MAGRIFILHLLPLAKLAIEHGRTFALIGSDGVAGLVQANILSIALTDGFWRTTP